MRATPLKWRTALGEDFPRATKACKMLSTMYKQGHKHNYVHSLYIKLALTWHCSAFVLALVLFLLGQHDLATSYFIDIDVTQISVDRF